MDLFKVKKYSTALSVRTFRINMVGTCVHVLHLKTEQTVHSFHVVFARACLI